MMRSYWSMGIQDLEEQLHKHDGEIRESSRADAFDPGRRRMMRIFRGSDKRVAHDSQPVFCGPSADDSY